MFLFELTSVCSLISVVSVLLIFHHNVTSIAPTAFLHSCAAVTSSVWITWIIMWHLQSLTTNWLTILVCFSIFRGQLLGRMRKRGTSLLQGWYMEDWQIAVVSNLLVVIQFLFFELILSKSWFKSDNFFLTEAYIWVKWIIKKEKMQDRDLALPIGCWLDGCR